MAEQSCQKEHPLAEPLLKIQTELTFALCQKLELSAVVKKENTK